MRRRKLPPQTGALLNETGQARRRKAGPAAQPDDLPAIMFALARRGWSVEDLARAVGADAELLKRWLRGGDAISQELRERIAAILAPGDE